MQTFPLIAGTFIVGLTALGLGRRSTLWRLGLLHNAAWGTGLVAFGSGVIRYDEVSDSTWVVIICGIAAFNLGLVLGLRPKMRTSELVSDRVPGSSSLVGARGLAAILAIFAFGLCVYLLTIERSYGIDRLISDPASIRAYSSAGYLEQFPIWGKVAFYLGPLAFLLTACPELVDSRKWRDAKAVRLCLLAILLIAQLAVLQRTNVFVSLLWVVGWRLTGQPRNARAMRAVVGGVLVSVVALGSFVGLAQALGKSGEATVLRSGYVSERLYRTGLYSPVFYATGGIAALDKLRMSDLNEWPSVRPGAPTLGPYNPQTWGLATLSGPSKVFPLERHWQEVAPFVATPLTTNVYTWYEPWYRDFRDIGAVVGALLMGMLIASLAARTQSTRARVMSALLLGLSALATFVNFFGFVLIWTLLLAVFVFGRARDRQLKMGSGQRLGSIPRNDLSASK
jgi:hypothetical protein